MVNMNGYIPDAWVVLKIVSPEHGTIYKLLSGWYGGYAGADSWRINSGIESVKDEGLFYSIIGYSGSEYKCNKNIQRMTGLMQSMYSSWLIEIEKQNANVEMSIVDISEIHK